MIGMDQRSSIIIRVGIALTCVIWVWYGGRDCIAVGAIAAPAAAQTAARLPETQ
jgi:hypothetical protein